MKYEELDFKDLKNEEFLDSWIRLVEMDENAKELKLPHPDNINWLMGCLDDFLTNGKESKYYRCVNFLEIFPNGEDTQARSTSEDPSHVSRLISDIKRRGLLTPLFLVENESNMKYKYTLKNGFHRHSALNLLLKSLLEKKVITSMGDFPIPAFVIGRDESYKVKPVTRTFQMLLNDAPPRKPNGKGEVAKFVKSEILTNPFDLKNEEEVEAFRERIEKTFGGIDQDVIKKTVSSAIKKELVNQSDIVYHRAPKWRQIAVETLGFTEAEKLSKDVHICKGVLPNKKPFRGFLRTVSSIGSTFDQALPRDHKIRCREENGRFNGIDHEVQSIWICVDGSATAQPGTVITSRETIFKEIRFYFDLYTNLIGFENGIKIAIPWDYILIAPQISEDCVVNMGTKKNPRVLEIKGEKTGDLGAWKLISRDEIVSFYKANMGQEEHKNFKPEWIYTSQ